MRLEELLEECYSKDDNDTILQLKALPTLTLTRKTFFSFVGDYLSSVQVLKNKQILTAGSHLNFASFGRHNLKNISGCPMVISTIDIPDKQEMDLFATSMTGGFEDLF